MSEEYKNSSIKNKKKDISKKDISKKDISKKDKKNKAVIEDVYIAKKGEDGYYKEEDIYKMSEEDILRLMIEHTSCQDVLNICRLYNIRDKIYE